MESQLEEEMAGTIMMSRRTVRVYVSAVLFLALKAVMFSLCKVE